MAKKQMLLIVALISLLFSTLENICLF